MEKREGGKEAGEEIITERGEKERKIVSHFKRRGFAKPSISEKSL